MLNVVKLIINRPIVNVTMSHLYSTEENCVERCQIYIVVHRIVSNVSCTKETYFKLVLCWTEQSQTYTCTVLSKDVSDFLSPRAMSDVNFWCCQQNIKTRWSYLVNRINYFQVYFHSTTFLGLVSFPVQVFPEFRSEWVRAGIRPTVGLLGSWRDGTKIILEQFHGFRTRCKRDNADTLPLRH